ncbi:hypothetical protein BCR34DRAFT_553361 [Clohesyomyces aquaticus]|uniref:Uncharacterized protein n=1 Tax=Clohesyomyces aquaticus TaxID=1231657 RepID=A0A1Y2A8C1_9PLEO|nr:hypothetical protein BCR34DRAFT_553361 [Clohesyomyces aquaticus]
MATSESDNHAIYKLIEEYEANRINYAEHVRNLPEPPTEEEKPKSEPSPKLPPIKEILELSFDDLIALEARTQNKLKSVKMPVHPAEENTTGSITDQVAKDSNDSTASDHSLHDVATGVGAQAHKAAPGPVVSESIGKPEGSKEDRQKRAAELNK